MKMFRIVFAALLASSTMGSFAQQPKPSQPHDWTPRGIGALRQSASSKTEFTLDHSMLVFASKLDSDNEDLKRVIAGVNGVAVHSFRYAAGTTYDPQSLGSVKEDYRAAGWKQMMNNYEKAGSSSATSLWIRMENNAFSNAAVLVTKPNEVDFVVVSGSVSPLDIIRLGGHFGIPKLEGGVAVPNNK
jgi:hypothetical protein